MIKKYLKVARSTISDPSFYARLTTADLANAVTMTALAGLCVAVAVAVFMGATLSPYIGRISSGITAVENTFPNDLAITLVHGHVSINQPEPYYVANPFGSDPKYAVIFDATGTTPEDLNKASTFALVRETYIVYADKASSSRIASFPDNESTSSVDHTRFVSSIEHYRPYAVPFAIGGGLITMILGVFFYVLVWTPFHMAYLLIPATILWIYAAVRGRKDVWGRMYVVALYASIPVIILSGVSFFTIALPEYTYTIAVLAIAIVNMERAKSKVAPKPPVEA